MMTAMMYRLCRRAAQPKPRDRCYFFFVLALEALNFLQSQRAHALAIALPSLSNESLCPWPQEVSAHIWGTAMILLYTRFVTFAAGKAMKSTWAYPLVATVPPQ